MKIKPEIKNILLMSLIIFLLLAFPVRAQAQDSYFTQEILAEFDGQNDEAAYIAARGRVYDATEVFTDGTYNDLEAGQDLTEELEAGPGFNILEQLNQVGYHIEAAFTPELLAEFDGRERPEAYAAIEGIVYDVTDVFSDGTHRGHEAGQELGEEFYQESPHDLETLADYPVVGLLIEETYDRAELTDYHGEEDTDTPAYAAVDGLVYDMSELWPEGDHFDYQAGEELSEEIANSPHGIGVMLDVSIVGALIEFLAVAPEEPEEENDFLFNLFIGLGVLSALSGLILGIHSFIFALKKT